MRRRRRPTTVRRTKRHASNETPLLDLDLTIEDVLLDLDPGWYRVSRSMDDGWGG